MSKNDRLLRLALRGNALFSLGSALVLIVFNDSLRDIMGIAPRWLLPAIGVGLALFAIELLRSATGPVVTANRAWAFVAMDASWVFASAILLTLGLLTPSGQWIVIGVALVVADFAILQYAGLRKKQQGAA